MKTRIVVVFVFLMCELLFAKNFFSQEITDDGNHTFTTTIATLKTNGIYEDVIIYNNSSYTLSMIKCKIRINGKIHELKTIERLLPTHEDNFAGYDDDEMKDELPHFFGADGKMTATNENAIIFTLSFDAHNNDVLIKKVYNADKSLNFEIIDNPNAKASDAIQNNNAERIFIDGQEYLRIDGQIYKVNQ